MNLTPEGINFIIEQETGGRDEYNPRPEWPGEASGVTIGIGYDIGYNSSTQVSQDWREHVLRADLARLVACSGIRGQDAKLLLCAVRDISVPWKSALEVFERVTVPRFYLQMLRIYPHADELEPNQTAALLSLVFNRGASLSGDRRREMLEIQSALRAGLVSQVPDLLRSMDRLWPNTKGLRLRRHREADLFSSIA
jgi:GH24 family phage-related lysozyme (muramidase)